MRRGNPAQAQHTRAEGQELGVGRRVAQRCEQRRQPLLARLWLRCRGIGDAVRGWGGSRGGQPGRAAAVEAQAPRRRGTLEQRRSSGRQPLPPAGAAEAGLARGGGQPPQGGRLHGWCAIACSPAFCVSRIVHSGVQGANEVLKDRVWPVRRGNFPPRRLPSAAAGLGCLFCITHPRLATMQVSCTLTARTAWRAGATPGSRRALAPLPAPRRPPDRRQTLKASCIAVPLPARKGSHVQQVEPGAPPPPAAAGALPAALPAWRCRLPLIGPCCAHQHSPIERPVPHGR